MSRNREYPKIQPGPLSIEQADMLNEALRDLANFMQIRTGVGLRLDEFGNSFTISLDMDLSFPARITGNALDANGNTAYSWYELSPAAGGTWIQKDSGRSGTVSPTIVHPAYEQNQSINVPVGRNVRMHYGSFNPTAADREFWFNQTENPDTSSSSGMIEVTVVTGVCPLISGSGS